MNQGSLGLRPTPPTMGGGIDDGTGIAGGLAGTERSFHAGKSLQVPKDKKKFLGHPTLGDSLCYLH